MSTSTTNYGFTKAAPGEQYSLPTTNTTLDLIDTAIKNADNKATADAQGILANPFDGTTSANFNNIEGLVNYQLVNLVANRRYRVDFQANVISTAAAAQTINIKIKKDTDTAATTTFTTGGTISNLSSITYETTNATASTLKTVRASVDFKATATETVLIKITGNLVAAGTNFQWQQRSIAIYDEGAQF